MEIPGQCSQSQKQQMLQPFNNSHPYEYLTKLNNIYSNYNRNAGKDYSSASKIKLPFKRFNTMKVPQWFEASYAKEKKDLVQYNSPEDARGDDAEKKLWREHRQIIAKYLQEKQEKKAAGVPAKNKQFAEKMLSKDRNNIFLKKIIEKGTKFEYDQKKFQEEILHKLKNLNKGSAKKLTRCQTAKPSSEVKQAKTEQSNGDNDRHKISECDFLEFNRESDMIVKYKGLIKQADCSISEKNIKKTSELLRQMQRIVDETPIL